MSPISATRARNLGNSTAEVKTGMLDALQLRARWDALGGRERRLVAVAGVLVASAMLWWIAIGPALATLRLAQEQHNRLDAQMQQMQTLRAQANQLVAMPKVSLDDAKRTLEAGLKQTLGNSAQLAQVGNRVTVTLKGASADGLAQWLLQARVNARALPIEVRLVKSAAGPINATIAGAGANGAATPATVNWDGSIVLRLPER